MICLLKKIHTFTQNIGKFLSVLSIVIMMMVTIEVMARYLFRSPTTWNWPITNQILGIFILYSGIYAMSYRMHLRIEILYQRFSPRLKFIAKLLSLACLIFFMACLIWQSAWLGLSSYEAREHVVGAFELPLYPLKLLIPIIAFLFLLEGIAIFFLYKEE